MTPIDAGFSRHLQKVIVLRSQHKLEWRRLYGIQDLALLGQQCLLSRLPILRLLL